MIENNQVFREFIAVGEIDRFQARHYLRQCGWVQSRPGQKQTQRIDVAPVRDTAQQGRFDDGCAPPHERVIDNVPWLSEALDKKSRQLRLKARPIRNLVKTAGGPLSSRPELVHAG